MAPVSAGASRPRRPAAPAPRRARAGRSRSSPARATRRRRYLAEILRAEGLNEFANVGVTDLTRPRLARYAVVVLGDVAITDAQVDRPDRLGQRGRQPDRHATRRRLSGSPGSPPTTGTVTDGYLAVNSAVEPGAGIATETMQFHGTANRYTLNGATVATLYTNATAATASPP